MKETLPRFLLPTADMKKAINRNAKNDEDLSFLLKRIEKEKKVALEQVSRRQKAFKREMIMRREIQSNINLNCQFFEHTDLTNKKDNEKARLDINLCNRRRKPGTAQGLRRASSFEESLASSKIELPPVRTKRYSLPASPIQAGCKEEELRVKSLKIDKPFPTPKVVTDFWTKSRNYEATNLFRRHSTTTAGTFVHVDDKSKLLDRRHTSLHNLSPFSTEKHFSEEETVIRLPF